MSRLQACVRVGTAVLALALAGCGGTGAVQHPLTNDLDPAYKGLDIKTLAALPFASDISESEDPDKISASMCEGKFYQALNAGSGFTVMPASEVGRVVAEQKLTDQMQSFYKKWTQDQSDVNVDFIKKVAAQMRADAVVVGVVDVWHQRPIDIEETGSARTSVGTLVGLFDGATGKRLWLGRDEQFKEAVRHTATEMTEDARRKEARAQMERTNLRTATGVYAPPEFAGVVDIVVNSLVQAFPKRIK